MTAIASPCRNVCRLDRAGQTCIGCGRSLAEIAGWLNFTPAERAAIMAQLPARLAKAPA